MAATRIANIINPEVLGDQISAKFPDMLVLGNSNLVQVDPEFPLGSPGTQQKLPFWHRIGGFSAQAEGVAAVPGSINADYEFLTVQRASNAFAVLDTAELVSKASAVDEISGQLSRRAAEYIDSSLVGQIELTPNVFDQTGALATNTNKTLDINALISAMMTLGDNAGTLATGARIIMHSKVRGDFLKLNQIQNQYQSGGDLLKGGMFPTVLGLPIEVSDLVTVYQGPAVGGITPLPVYHTYIVAPGALMLAYQRAVTVEYDRDILLQADVVMASMHFAPHLYGWDDSRSQVVYEQNKSIHAVVLKSN